jgi:cysteine desulfurase
VRDGVALDGLLGGGRQEAGRRSGTEPVALVAGLAGALELASEHLSRPGAVQALRDGLLRELLAQPGLRLSGVDPFRDPLLRLPHHISLVVSGVHGRPLSGRCLVRELWQEGYAVSSGSACRSSGSGASSVLLALGYDEAEAGSGLRISLGPWLDAADLAGFPMALARVRHRLSLKP